ncbi:MAG: TspO/MBR family protein [Patescibacteria group bacterium]
MIAKYFKLLAFIVLCELVGVLGSVSTISAIPTWYAGLTKPFFSPPNYLFGPVWTILYALMGISIFRILELKKKKVVEAANLFWIQLFLNGIWTPIFFGSKQFFFAFIVIVFMWVYILKTIRAFAKIDKFSSYLLYPYLAWVSFATLLNFSIWFLNR